MEWIKLEQYNPIWEKLFCLEEKLIKETLGENLIEVYHVGSTAVKDLLSKPIIDIAIEAKIFPPSLEIIESLAKIDYLYKGEAGVKGRIWFIKGNPRKINLHYSFLKSEIIEKQIHFRNQLQKNELARRKYEKIKIENSLNQDIDSTKYALSKSMFIDEMLKLD